MADLYPTKTRLKLLRGVQRREVTYYVGSGDSYWDGEGNGRQVTARAEELRWAEWIHTSDAVVDGTRSWALTEAGLRVLEEAGGGT